MSLTHETTIARQAITDRERRIHGYELFFRADAFSTSATRQDAAATLRVISYCLPLLGSSREELKWFINAPREFLVNDLSFGIDPAHVVLEVQQDVDVDARLLAGVTELRDAGFAIALDRYSAGFPGGHEQLLPLASYVKLDFLGSGRSDLRRIPGHLRGKGQFRLVGTRIGAERDLALAQEIGCDLLQGYAVSLPVTEAYQELPVALAPYVILLRELSRPDVGLPRIAHLVEGDPALSWALLRASNSARAAQRREIASIEDAVHVLGLNAVREWTYVMVAQSVSDGDEARIEAMLESARLYQLVAPDLGVPGDTGFLVGLLVEISAALRTPMDNLLAEFPIDRSIAAGILARQGPVGRLLDVIEQYRLRFSAGPMPGLEDVDPVSSRHLQAMVMASDLASASATAPPAANRPAAGWPAATRPAATPSVAARPSSMAQDYVSAWLTVPVEIAEKEEFTLTAGLRRPDPLVTADTSPAGPDIEVILVFDPDSFELLSPDAGFTLQRTAILPWPEGCVRLVARAAPTSGPGPGRERRIGAAFLRHGHIVDYLSCDVVVRPEGASAPSAPSGARPLTSTGPPRDLHRVRDDAAPDLTVFIVPADAGERLVFRAVCPHLASDCPARQLSADLRLDGTSVTDPRLLAETIRRHVARSDDGLELFTWLHGVGRQLFLSLPGTIRRLLSATLTRGTPDVASTVLFATTDPWTPWELTAPDTGLPWVSGVDKESPFLGAHAAVSHWTIEGLSSRTADPISHLTPRHRTLVARTRPGVPPTGPPPADAALARILTETVVVPPVLNDVIRLLHGDPPADLVHFAVRGTVEDPGDEPGLFLLEAAGAPRVRPLNEHHVTGVRLTRPAFVFINACQVSGSDGLPVGDYVGFAAAFLTAGAGAVIAPAWNTDDDSAYRFAAEFYDLSSGADPVPAAEILRRFRARYHRGAVGRDTPKATATFLAYRLFGHPGLRIFLEN